MDGMYGFHSTSDYTISPEYNPILPAEHHGIHSSVDHSLPFYGSDDLYSVAASVVSDSFSIETTPDQIILPRRRNNRHRDQATKNGVDVRDDEDASSDLIKEKIASHPSYSKLLDAYIDCHKVGAPPEIACFLDDIRLENDARKRNSTASTCLGVDPELDMFMETYCHVLVKYKSDLTRPFDEASIFLGDIKTQLRNLCQGLNVSIFSLSFWDFQWWWVPYLLFRNETCEYDRILSDEGTHSSEEEFSGGETDNNTLMSQELKDTLLRKFGGHISSLKQQFTKKKKKGKLPNEARQTLLQWWNSHNKWPYPTEGDKVSLAETTGLDQKQINNWFINQRKRHWKPSESMQLAVMGAGLPGHYFYDH